ncbi:photosynthetic complex assembly protein PuhC [uncultured Methylobacterium sp.]|jgi:putative photosynthetic complex assembly protein|uniref:photosynthetic complex assembly protein PuhC n=1 Tax=uncultured Methylobacterium sp. TaxID=157278 RepID=UPI0035C9E1D6
MRDETEGGRMPRLLLGGAAGLLGFAVLAVFVGREGGVGLTHMAPARAVEAMEIRADDEADGSIAIREDRTGRLVATVEKGQDNFIRATLRGFAQSRLREGLTREKPFRLTRFDDGSLELDDTLTGRKVNLGAFGPTNAQAFARLMPATHADAGATR